MDPLPHRYEVHVTGGPTGHGRASAIGLPSVAIAPPPQFDGPGDAWSPEHLLLASVEACFLFTLRALADYAKVDFRVLDIEAFGTVDRGGGVTRFVEIVLQPRIRVPAGTARDAVLRILAKTEKACLVTASLSTPVRVEPTVVIADDGSQENTQAA
jgi:organic hydroperoxide reductase OsmC/OhrA